MCLKNLLNIMSNFQKRVTLVWFMRKLLVYKEKRRATSALPTSHSFVLELLEGINYS